MKTLVAYYSMTGNNAVLAKEIASRLGSEIEEISDGKKRSGIVGMMRGVIESFLKLKPKIQPPRMNPQDYDLVVLCSPIWAQHFASPLGTYIAQNKGKFKKLAFATISGGGKNPSVVESIEKAAGIKVAASLDIAVLPPGEGGKPKDIMGAKLTSEDIKKEYYSKAIDDFIKSLT